MHAVKPSSATDKPTLYADLARQLQALFEHEPDAIANAANMAALIFHSLPGLNWAGFYFMKAGQLVLGPFQGKPACLRIAVGKGVCGTAVQRRRAVRVADVHEFPGHIACDAASLSELVIPIINGAHVLGVLDLDSPAKARFDAEDQAGAETLVELFLAHQRRHPGSLANLLR
jgi:L-methionine (R)-S-oxide reductase